MVLNCNNGKSSTANDAFIIAFCMADTQAGGAAVNPLIAPDIVLSLSNSPFTEF